MGYNKNFAILIKMISSVTKKVIRRFTMDEFFKLSKEYQVKCFLQNRCDKEYSTHLYIDSTEKTGFYNVRKSIRISASGVFFRKSTLNGYIVYNKKTKKCKVNNENTVRTEFLEKYFFKSDYYLMNEVLGKLTPTLCKKIIEGKICTIGDIMRYHKSYTIRNKNANINELFAYKMADIMPIYNCTTDREHIFEIGHKRELRALIPHDYLALKPFNISLKELKSLGGKYEEWRRKITTEGAFDESEEDNIFPSLF